MKITSSELKGKLVGSGKGLITSLGLKAKARPHKYKKSRYASVNVSMKELSKIMREFEKFPYESYERKRPKYDPTDSYFYLERQLAKCMMRSHFLNSHIYPVRTEMTAPSLHACSTDERELKEFLVDKTLLQICSTDEDESKGIIVDKCSKEDDKPK